MLYPDPPPPSPDRRIHSAGFTIIDYDDPKKIDSVMYGNVYL